MAKRNSVIESTDNLSSLRSSMIGQFGIYFEQFPLKSPTSMQGVFAQNLRPVLERLSWERQQKYGIAREV